VSVRVLVVDGGMLADWVAGCGVWVVSGLPGGGVGMGLSDAQVAALAEVFADPVVARQVVAEAGLPVPDVPWGSQSSRVFWRAVADLLGHGAVVDGLDEDRG